MISVDLKPLLQRLNGRTTKAMEGAAGLCVARGHYEVTVEHVLVKITEDADGDVVQILSHFDIDAAGFLRAVQETVDDLKTGNTGRPVLPVLRSSTVSCTARRKPAASMSKCDRICTTSPSASSVIFTSTCSTVTS